MYELYYLLARIISVYQFLVFVYVLAGWLINFGVLPMGRPMYAILDVLERLCEPSLRLVRGFLPMLGGLDLSPIVVIFGLELVKMALARLMFA
jgi:YggT family protein